MARAGNARRKNDDEIPLAMRISPRIRAQSRFFIFILVLIIFLVSISFVFFLGAPFWDSKLDISGKGGGLSSGTGQLLGHLSYSEAAEADLVTVYPGLRVHRDTSSALSLMSSAALRDGVDLVLLSGFRSIALQKEIFYENKSIRNQIAIERARVSAPPGYSEHSTGYAIDLGDANRRDTDFEVSFETTKAFRWLQKNAAKYHFVLSFPKGNFQKVSYEPWHWRFEGTVDALRKFEVANERRRVKENSN